MHRIRRNKLKVECWLDDVVKELLDFNFNQGIWNKKVKLPKYENRKNNRQLKGREERKVLKKISVLILKSENKKKIFLENKSSQK